MQSVLECLSCPSLTSLTLHNDSWRTSSVGVSSELLKDIHEAFCAFIGKVSRSLVCLNLQETLAMSRPFAPVFQMCRVLEDLSIREAGLAPPDMDIDPVLRGLVATSEQPLLLPSLRNLIVSVNGRWASKETLLLIREVIISREASQQSRTLESAVFVLPETIVHGRTDLSEFYDIQRRNTTVVKVAGFLSEKVFVGYTELQLDYPEVKNTEVSVPSVFLSGWKWWEKVARFIW
ncbi:hypothetical protein V5O48_010663 [Marasmius crinis-equi]|uniref:Uncharacterized protein n=1 Tax=Marasmius crinis-equi TaxID=585013 RepID=A0ABR3F7Q6_9AGAR